MIHGSHSKDGSSAVVWLVVLVIAALLAPYVWPRGDLVPVDEQAPLEGGNPDLDGRDSPTLRELTGDTFSEPNGLRADRSVDQPPSIASNERDDTNELPPLADEETGPNKDLDSLLSDR